MSTEERSFWNEFLAKVMEVIDDEKGKGTDLPYKFPAELFSEFQTAISVYDGDNYCQINQIRNLFDCDVAAITGN